MFPDIRRVGEGVAGRTLFCLLVLWASLGAGLASAASEPVGKTESLKGSVAVEREGYSGPVAVSDPVYLRDKWETQEDSGTELVFVDESRIQMGPKASLEITEYLYQPQEKVRDGLISMMSGKVRFVVQDLQDYKQKRMRVQTQTAVVGTRGTDFIVWVVSPEITRVLGISSDIDFCNAKVPGACVTVSPNMTSEVRANVVAPTAPVVAPPEVIKEMHQGVEKVTSTPPTTAPPPPPPPTPPDVSQTYDPTVSISK
jgi:hypothetical protein